MNGEKDSAGQIHSSYYSPRVPKQSNYISHQDLRIAQNLSTQRWVIPTCAFSKICFLSGFKT